MYLLEVKFDYTLVLKLSFHFIEVYSIAKIQLEFFLPGMFQKEQFFPTFAGVLLINLGTKQMSQF